MNQKIEIKKINWERKKEKKKRKKKKKPKATTPDALPVAGAVAAGSPPSRRRRRLTVLWSASFARFPFISFSCPFFHRSRCWVCLLWSRPRVIFLTIFFLLFAPSAKNISVDFTSSRILFILRPQSAQIEFLGMKCVARVIFLARAGFFATEKVSSPSFPQTCINGCIP